MATPLLGLEIMFFLAIKEIFRLSLTLLILITLPLVIFTLISSKIEIFGIRSFVVLTGSMEPNLPVGSVVYTQKKSDYKKGDVITFKTSSTFVTHRIIQTLPEGFKTKGDANNTVDSNIVSQKSIEGAQVYRVFNLGKLIMNLKTIPGFFIFIVIPALILIILELWNIKKEFEKHITKKLLKEIQHQFKLLNER